MRSLPAPNVVIAADDVHLLDEMIRYLEEVPQWSVRSVTDLSAFDDALASTQPEAVVVSDSVARALAGLGRQLESRVIVFGREEDSNTLRAAIRLGAAGFIRWPEERAELKHLVERGIKNEGKRTAGELVAVWSPKGGGGASVLSANLAGAMVDMGGSPVLVDLDLDFGDLAMILGAEDQARPLTDLLRVVDELTMQTAEGACATQQAGLRVLLNPGIPGESQLVKPSDVVRLLSILRESAPWVVVDLPSSTSELNLAVIEEASVLLMIVVPSSLSIRRAREAVKGLAGLGVDLEKVSLVVNQFLPGQIGTSEIEAIVGAKVSEVIRADMELLRSADKGALSVKGKRLLTPLAANLMGLSRTDTSRFRLRR